MATTSETITTDYVDLLITADGDLAFSDGDLVLTTDNATSLVQRLRMRLNIWKNEWIYDATLGIDWWSYLGKPIIKSAVDAEIKRQILLESDVERFINFNSTHDRANRSYVCAFEVLTSEGTTEALAYYLNDSYEYSVPDINIGTCQIVADTITFGNKLYKLINFDLRKLGSATWITEQMLTEGYGASGYGEEYGD